MSKRCENEIKRALEKDRERCAKLVCPLCRHAISRSGDVHLIKIEDGETTGMWAECLAARIRYPSAAPQAKGKRAPEGQNLSPAVAALDVSTAAQDLVSKEK